MDAELEALAELLIELLVVILLLSNLREHLQALLDQVLLDNPEDLVLLQCLARDVQGQVLGVDDTLHEVEPLGHKLIAIIHDEDPAHIELDVIALLLRLEEIKGRTAWHEEQRAELELALYREVLHGKVILPIVGERLVE